MMDNVPDKELDSNMIQQQLINAYKRIDQLSYNLIKECDNFKKERIAGIKIQNNYNYIKHNLQQVIKQIDAMNAKLKTSYEQVKSQIQSIKLTLSSFTYSEKLLQSKFKLIKPGLVVFDISTIESECGHCNTFPYLFKFIEEENRHSMQKFIQLLIDKGAILLYHHNCQEYGITFKNIDTRDNVWICIILNRYTV